MLYIKAFNAAVLGFLSHVFIFIRGEYHTKIFKILSVYSLLALLTLLNERNCHPRFWIRSTALIISSHFFGLLGSMTVYRIYFHPLRYFPGPPLAKVSKMWHVKKVINRQNHVLLEEMRRKYGNFVRTGPSELTVFEAEVFHSTSGPGTTCIKSEWYDMLYPLVALNSIRDKRGYASRRKMWDQAFKATALKRDIPTIVKYANSLLKSIENAGTEPIAINNFFSRFAYAVMSDLAFGRPFQSLDDKRIDENVALIQAGMDILGFVSPAPWLAQLLFNFPGLAYGWNRMLELAGNNVKERLNANTSSHDFSSWLIEASHKNDGFVDTNSLYGDALAVSVAGSHSTAATLVFLFYELALKPSIQKKLRSEILRSSRPLDVDALNESQYLNACVNETFRLYPILPTAGARQTQNGITVAEQYIPPHTNIIAPRYSIGRMEEYFQRATEFIPERWTERVEMVKDHRAYNPFNIGRHTCPGRWLGRNEICIVVALLLARFEVILMPGKRNETGVIDDLKDNFTAHPGQLELIFRKL